MIKMQMRQAAPMLAAVAMLAATGVAEARSDRQATPAYSDSVDAGNSLAGNYLSAVVAGASRDTSAAAFFYREALRDDPRSPGLNERAFVSLLAEGAYPDAVRLAERLAQRENMAGLATLTLGIRDIKAKRFQKARERFAQGGKNRATDFTASLLTAWSWLGSGNPKKAIATVDAMKGDDIALFRNYHAGLMADIAGDKAEAGRRLKAAYDLEPRSLRMVDVYGRHLSRAGKPEEALKVYREFDKLLPRHPLVTAAIASLEAGKTLESAVPNAVAGAGEVLYGVGAAGTRQGDELAAMIYLRLALWLAPDNSMAIITLGDIYDNKLKQFERANDTYDMIAAGSPLRRTADIQIALNLEQLDRKDEAVNQLKQALDRNPKDLETLTALGNVYRSRKDFAKAAETYSKALEVVGTPDIGHWTLYYFRGIAYERTKQWPKAEADLRKALELNPDQPLVLNYLGYSWVDQHMNLDEAFAMLKRAVDQRPTDGYIVDSLGWAYFRLGRYDEAVGILEKAVELKASDPVINDHLGDAYWKVGRKLEATFQWNHARDLKPEPEDLPAILRKIERGGLEDDKPAAEAEGKPVDVKSNGG